MPYDKPTPSTDEQPYIERDCPWHDPEWLLDHPEFPLRATNAAAVEPSP